MLTDRVLTGAAAHWIYGRLQRTRRSRRRIAGFVASLGIDLAEAERPLDAYGSLDDFFTRRLRAGARPIDPDPAHLLSPADARTLVVPRLDGACLRVKGTQIDLDELLRDAALARRYAGGAALIARLAPADYHRFHFPDDGVASPARAIGGRLHSVHPIALAAGAPSLANKRTVTLLDSRGFGPLALVEVGALCVGTIVQTYRPGTVRRGDEKGIFRFGGSTVVLLAEPGRLGFDDDLVECSREGMETLVRVGTRVARRP
jgi:phosphatidylserine decarboxylase